MIMGGELKADSVDGILTAIKEKVEIFTEGASFSIAVNQIKDQGWTAAINLNWSAKPQEVGSAGLVESLIDKAD